MTIVYIGRFQPFHNAHLETIIRASKFAFSENILIIIGSANQPRTIKNPFTSEERRSIIEQELISRNINNFSIEETYDSIYNDEAWAKRIQSIISKYPKPVSIIGCDKDESSFYLKMFPHYKRIHVDLIEPLNAESIRDLYFRLNCNLNFIKSVVPSSTFKFLETFKNTTFYDEILREKEFIQNYKKQFESLKYPPTFVTADAVVIQSGHILLIKRKSFPGKDLWALPGGFLSPSDKSIQDAMIRELREETKIKVPVPVLVGNIKDSKVFDAINRSSRGRTITHAFHIKLPDGELPKVKGSDDAEKAKWVPLSDISRENFFEDHIDIISYFIGE